jgi:hypothetical protein
MREIGERANHCSSLLLRPVSIVGVIFPGIDQPLGSAQQPVCVLRETRGMGLGMADLGAT